MTNLSKSDSGATPVDFAAQSPAVPAASLPPELRRLVDQVLKKSRLWPSERLDIESELAAHFADGLASGMSVQQLARDFGDPAAAAKLIRRGKVRNRSSSWKLLHAVRLGLIGTTALVIGSYALFAFRFYTGVPSINRNIKNELNAPIVALPVSQRAWPAYRDAMRLMVNPAPKPADTPDSSGANKAAIISPFDSPDGAKVNQVALGQIRKAAAIPNLGAILNDPEDRLLVQQQSRLAGVKEWEKAEYPLPPEGSSTIQILLPHLTTVRSFARLLAQDAQDAADSGNGLRAGEDLVAMARIAVQVRETGFLISDLVSIALGDLAMNKLRQVLTQHPGLLDNSALEEFASALKSMGPRGCLARFDVERLGFEDVLQRSFTDDGHGDGRLTPDGVRFLSEMMQFAQQPANDRNVVEFASAPLSATIGPGRKAVHDAYFKILQETEEWGKEPAWHRGPPPVIDPKAHSIANPLSFISVLTPAVIHAVELADRFDENRQAALAIIQIELYKREHGEYPEHLKEAFGTLKSSLPLDLADGQPLRYKREGSSYTLYSIGSNKQDDGGIAPKTTAEESEIKNFRLAKPPAGIDWVFFPWTDPVDTSPKGGGMLGGM